MRRNPSKRNDRDAHGICNEDLLILISSSGNSPNIIEAVKYAQSKQCLVIGLTGFDGGELKKLADVSLHVDSQNYGVIEDCHQSIMHIIAQYRYKSMHV